MSVVIPVYNPGPLLLEQLEALRGQDFEQSWEVVLADNGCTDDSLTAAVELAARPGWPIAVRVVDARRRRGPAHARNRGAACARGEWIAFCDADDVAAPGWLSALYERRVETGLVVGALDVTALNDERLLLARGGPEVGLSMPIGPCEFLPYASSGNVLIRRSLLLDLGGWEESLTYCEDVELSWRVQLGGGELVFAPDAVMRYRYRGSAAQTFGQLRRYKISEAALFRRFRSAGARRRSLGQVGQRWWWLLSRAPYVALGLQRRMLWFSIAGAEVGHVQGSWRHRVRYL